MRWENTDRAAMVPVDMGWSDIGSWAALTDALADTGDVDGYIVRGTAADFDHCRPRVVHRERGLAVADLKPYATENRRSIADAPV